MIVMESGTDVSDEHWFCFTPKSPKGNLQILPQTIDSQNLTKI